MTKKADLVLVVDDDPASVDLARWAIQDAGLIEHIDVAHDGQQALDHLRTSGRRPDIIMLDINMPGMDGFQFLDAYHELPLDLMQGVIVVMLTTSLLDKDRQRAEAYSNVLGFYDKPPTAEMIAEVVHMWWKHRA